MEVTSNKVMVSCINELVEMDEVNLNDFERDVVKYQKSAAEKARTPNRDRIDEYFTGVLALLRALEYLTERKTKPLTSQQYAPLLVFASRNYPRNFMGNWFGTFRKVIRENGVPISHSVEKILEFGMYGDEATLGHLRR